MLSNKMRDDNTALCRPQPRWDGSGCYRACGRSGRLREPCLRLEGRGARAGDSQKEQLGLWVPSGLSPLQTLPSSELTPCG